MLVALLFLFARSPEAPVYMYARYGPKATTESMLHLFS
jgi:hypothetical protein